MKYFMFMAGTTGRWVRGVLGFAVVAWGYSYYNYPENMFFVLAGALIMLLAMFNLSLFAPIAGLPVSGKKIIKKHGEVTGMPGEKNDVQ